MRFAVNKYLIRSYCLAALLAASVCSCAREDANTIESQMPAPGVDYLAVIFHRKPETLRTETENISIVKYGQPLLNDIGNIYCASRETTGAPQKIWLNWRNSNTLQIFRDPSTHSYREEKHFECMTGVLLQTTPFVIEYGDYRDIRPNSGSDDKNARDAKGARDAKAAKDAQTAKASRTGRKKRQN